MIKELSFHFILGGVLLSTIYYFANIIEDPSLSAIIALLPISLLAGIIIKKRDICKKYYKNAIPTLIITILLILLLIKLLDLEKYPKNMIIFAIIIMWIILQYCRHKIYKIT
jgi:uncharacterized membrane protein YoaK (UPF0700 family)